jgi:hypothetical protein
MSKRIKELVDAEMTAYYDAAYFDSGCARDQLRQFAEQIVRECAQVANHSNQSKNRAAGQSVGDVVRDHFGVKE